MSRWPGFLVPLFMRKWYRTRLAGLRCNTRQRPVDVASSALYHVQGMWPLGGSSAPGFPPPRSSKQQTELRSKRGERTSETASDRDF